MDYKILCTFCKGRLTRAQGMACWTCFPSLAQFKYMNETTKTTAHRRPPRPPEAVLKLHPSAETWFAEGNPITCAVSCLNRKVEKKTFPNCIWGPYVADEDSRVVAERLAAIPQEHRCWGVILFDNQFCPVTFYLDLEAFEETWKFAQTEFLEELGYKVTETYFCPDTQMWIALRCVASELQRKFALKAPIQDSDWWLFENDRTVKSESKLSRRAYLPHLAFSSLTELRLFMNDVHFLLENTVREFAMLRGRLLKEKLEREQEREDFEEEQEKEEKKTQKQRKKQKQSSYTTVDSDFQQILLPAKPGETALDYCERLLLALSHISLPQVTVNAQHQNKVTWLHYIDFGVYSKERQMRIPTCVKEHQNLRDKSKNPAPLPLTLLQAGSLKWLQQYVEADKGRKHRRKTSNKLVKINSQISKLLTLFPLDEEKKQTPISTSSNLAPLQPPPVPPRSIHLGGAGGGGGGGGGDEKMGGGEETKREDKELKQDKESGENRKENPPAKQLSDAAPSQNFRKRKAESQDTTRPRGVGRSKEEVCSEKLEPQKEEKNLTLTAGKQKKTLFEVVRPMQEIQVLAGMILHPNCVPLERPSVGESFNPFYWEDNKDRPKDTKRASHLLDARKRKCHKFEPLSPKELEEFPKEIFQILKEWLKKYGDDKSEIEIAGTYWHLFKKIQTKFYALRVKPSPSQEPRKCWTGVVHERNNGWFRVRFQPRIPLQQNNSKGAFEFRCHSVKCASVKREETRFTIHGIYPPQKELTEEYAEKFLRQ